MNKIKMSYADEGRNGLIDIGKLIGPFFLGNLLTPKERMTLA